mgnify:CR=1 FL=1
MKRLVAFFVVAALLLLESLIFVPSCEAKKVTMQEDGVTILPGSMQKIKLNEFTIGASARIQVAVNKRVTNRTVNVYLAYEFQLVGLSTEELPYKNFPQSRENVTKVDFTYTNDDGETYFLVIANPERYQGERDLPGAEAVVSYKIEITVPEEEKSSLPLIVSIIIILLALFFIIIMFLRKRRAAQAYQQAFYQDQYPKQLPAIAAPAYPGTYPTTTPSTPTQLQPAPVPPSPQIEAPTYNVTGPPQQYPPTEGYPPQEYPPEAYPAGTSPAEVFPQAPPPYPQEPPIEASSQPESTYQTAPETPPPPQESTSETQLPENPPIEGYPDSENLQTVAVPEEENPELPFTKGEEPAPGESPPSTQAEKDEGSTE